MIRNPLGARLAGEKERTITACGGKYYWVISTNSLELGNVYIFYLTGEDTK